MKKGLFCILAMFIYTGIFAQQQPVVAVAPFEAISGISATDANMITRVFFIRLGNTNKVSLVDRGVVERVLQEHHFQAGDWSNQQKTAELGKALNTDWIVRGELEKFGSNILVTVQFYDIQTFRFMGGSDLRLANADEAYDKMDPLVNKLVETIASTGTRTPTTPIRPITTGTYKIGDKGPGGGIIFSVRDGKYMECSDDLGLPIEWRLANQLANNYDGGGLTDWHLPTREELDLMYVNLRLRSLGRFDTSNTNDDSDKSGYWSSQNGWIQNFATGKQIGNKPEAHKYRTRAVRSFTGSPPLVARHVTTGTYKVGDRGPGSGTIFSVRDGKYMECSDDLGSPIEWRLANQLAYNHDGGGFSDWRLPTREELDLMYVNLRLRGLGGFDISSTNDDSDKSGYWSSQNGWIQNFATGKQIGNKPEAHKYRTRAVRTF